MFQLTSQAHFMGLILHGSAIVQLTAVNALPQPSNVQERQFATQMEHARVNIKNLNNFNDKPKLFNEKLIRFFNSTNIGSSPRTDHRSIL